MEKNRRDFIKIAGASAIALATAPTMNAHAIGEHFIPDAQVKTDKAALTAKQWGMVIDLRKITPEIMEKMQEECNKVHNVPHFQEIRHEIKWIWEEHFSHAFTSDQNKYLSESMQHAITPVLCNHCANPPCVKACPTKATFKREDGIVIMDFHRCIGCRFCMAACPYGSRSFNFQDPRNGLKDKKPTNPEFPTRMKGVVEKCNFCAERLAVGQMPICVEVSEGALVFGDINDPKSTIREVLNTNFTIRRNPALGTEPSVFYIAGGGENA